MKIQFYEDNAIIDDTSSADSLLAFLWKTADEYLTPQPNTGNLLRYIFTANNHNADYFKFGAGSTNAAKNYIYKSNTSIPTNMMGNLRFNKPDQARHNFEVLCDMVILFDLAFRNKFEDTEIQLIGDRNNMRMEITFPGGQEDEAAFILTYL